MSVSQRALGRELGAGLFTRQRVVAVALGLLALLLAFLIAHDVLFPAAPSAAVGATASVVTGTVRSAVSGTGTVVPAAQQNLSFGVAGTLSEIDVKVGDHVTKGQTLAKLDPTTFQQALDQANNNLTAAQATLNSTLNGNAVQQAQHSLATAQQSLSDAQAQVNLTNQQDANAVANDQNALNSDQANLSTAQTNLTNAQAPIAGDKQQLATAQTAYNTAGCVANPTSTTCQTLAADLNAATAKLNSDQATLNAAQTSFNTAQAAVNSDQNKLAADQSKQAADQISGQRTINQANASVTSAQDSLNSQTITRPNTIASQQASVANAQIAVATAQRNLDQATLVAPMDGSIMSIAGQVGETASQGGGTTAQAPGTTAPQPSSSGATSTASSGASSAGAFMVIGNVSGLEVVAPFAEADAARLAANQTATITFDAVSSLTVPAHVIAVAANATVISNVTNYYATLVIDRLDQRLKSGMTANASIIVQQVQNVLTLRNSAITRVGGAAFVTLLGKDGKTETRQPVQVGVVGDTSTEIVSGLNEGDRVVLPTLRAPSGTTGVRGGGFGGGGAVRVGG